MLYTICYIRYNVMGLTQRRVTFGLLQSIFSRGQGGHGREWPRPFSTLHPPIEPRLDPRPQSSARRHSCSSWPLPEPHWVSPGTRWRGRAVGVQRRDGHWTLEKSIYIFVLNLVWFKIYWFSDSWQSKYENIIPILIWGLHLLITARKKTYLIVKAGKIKMWVQFRKNMSKSHTNKEKHCWNV